MGKVRNIIILVSDVFYRMYLSMVIIIYIIKIENDKSRFI